MVCQHQLVESPARKRPAPESVRSRIGEEIPASLTNQTGATRIVMDAKP